MGIGGFIAKPAAGIHITHFLINLAVLDMSVHVAKAVAKSTAENALTLDAYCHSMLITQVSLNPIITDCGPQGSELIRKRRKSLLGGVVVVDGAFDNLLSPKRSRATSNAREMKELDSQIHALEELLIQEQAALAEPMLLNIKVSWLFKSDFDF